MHLMEQKEMHVIPQLLGGKEKELTCIYKIKPSLLAN